MYQAHIDDSVEHGRVLILGGLIALPERWRKFSDEWRKWLVHARLPAFKMNEMWDRRQNEELWEHMPWFYSVIRDYAQFGIAFAIPLEAFEHVVARYPVIKKSAGNPYFWAIKGIINLTAQFQREVGINDPIDFIFDDRREERQVRDAWSTYKTTLSAQERAVTGRDPIFENDERVLPLQAADMWVWWCRHQWLELGTLMKVEFPIPWGKLSDFGNMLFEWTEADMELEFSRVTATWQALLVEQKT